MLAGSLGDFIDEYVRRLEQGRVQVYQPDGDQFPDDLFMLELQAASGEFVESYGFRLIRYLRPPVEAGQGFDPVPLPFQPAALCGEGFLKVSQRLVVPQDSVELS